MYGAPAAPSPPVAPSPPTAGSSARYVYLLSRLRTRQITMEEATELFSIQQGMIRAAPSRAEPTEGGPGGGPGPAAGRPAPAVSDDSLAMGLLALGTGAGVLAALLKRAKDGPKAPAKPASP